MVWTVITAIASVIVAAIAIVIWFIVPWYFDRPMTRLLASPIWMFADAMSNKRFEDPVYKKNLQRLIERNRRFEETRE